MLGDSITAHAAYLYPDAWADAFEGLDALPLGVYGDSIHKLVWRLLVRRRRAACGRGRAASRRLPSRRGCRIASCCLA